MSKEMKVSAAVKKDPKTYDSITKLSNPELLQLVRLSWMAQSQQYLSPSGLQFVQSVVEPCLKCVVHRVPDNLADVMAKFSQCIASGQCTDSEVARIKIACGAIDGSMEDHPLLSGISLQCLRMLEKAERGIMTLKGRRSSESNYEAELIQQAGIHLSIACGNRGLAKEFGLPKYSFSTDELQAKSLPSPALALSWEGQLAENLLLADQRYMAREGRSVSARWCWHFVARQSVAVDSVACFCSACSCILRAPCCRF